MGYFHSKSVNNQLVNYTNNISQVSQSTCQYKVSDTQSNQQIVVIGSNISGTTIGQSEVVNTDTSCMISASMAGDMENLIQSLIKQDFSTGSGPLSWGNITTSTNQDTFHAKVANNIYQINQTTCGSKDITTQDNQYIYLVNSSINDSVIGQSINTSAQDSCALNNYSRFALYNKTASADQYSFQTGSMFSSILALIGGLVILALIIGVGVVGLIFFEKVFSGSKGNSSAAKPVPAKPASSPSKIIEPAITSSSSSATEPTSSVSQPTSSAAKPTSSVSQPASSTTVSTSNSPPSTPTLSSVISNAIKETALESIKSSIPTLISAAASRPSYTRQPFRSTETALNNSLIGM